MADENALSGDGRKSRAIASFISVSFMITIGIPIWWNTTKVYRATLPYDELQELQNLKLHINVSVDLIWQQDFHTQEDTLQTLSDKLNLNDSKKDDHIHINFNLRGRKINPNENQLLASSMDNVETLDDGLQELWATNDDYLEYKFIIVSDKEAVLFDHGTDIFIGKYRHALLSDFKGLSEAVNLIANVTRNIFLPRAIMKLQVLKESQPRTKIDEIRAFKSVTGYQLSFNLINDEPETGIVKWNIEQAISDVLKPFVNKIKYFDVTFDSQVLYYSGLNLAPKTDNNVKYLTVEDLPQMINPIESKLGSFVSLNPSLNFIVYIPRWKDTPLKIIDDNGVYVATNAFLSPRWGGLVIHNVHERSENATETPPIIRLKMSPIMKIFLTQIRALVGIKHEITLKGVTMSSFLNSGVQDWEVDRLLLKTSLEYLSTSVKTLTSLTQLMDKVKNMIIADKIKIDIENALMKINQCQEALSQGRIITAFQAAKRAVQLSEKAFYDPSVLELLYFPDDQKFAIYIPLFLPMSLPLVLSLFASIKWLRKRDELKDVQSSEGDEIAKKKDE
ncbi:GPI transamidase component PIG-S-like [Xenia sp. Carnegie-2017]|uniref:GPI transamidase component PIG-S-like n=1 Tax=Xenia sp. Carnegie-2017 TaxID=2897299 RepID=UPI001F038325|nr:GPI transamidase component PIG-S-like [Xenia sp. Carnegie-2017]